MSWCIELGNGKLVNAEGSNEVLVFDTKDEALEEIDLAGKHGFACHVLGASVVSFSYLTVTPE